MLLKTHHRSSPVNKFPTNLIDFYIFIVSMHITFQLSRNCTFVCRSDTSLINENWNALAYGFPSKMGVSWNATDVQVYLRRLFSIDPLSLSTIDSDILSLKSNVELLELILISTLSLHTVLIMISFSWALFSTRSRSILILIVPDWPNSSLWIS